MVAAVVGREDAQQKFTAHAGVGRVGGRELQVGSVARHFHLVLFFLILRQTGSTVLRIQRPVRRLMEFPSQDFGGGHICEFAVNDRSHAVPARILEMPG